MTKNNIKYQIRKKYLATRMSLDLEVCKAKSHKITHNIANYIMSFAKPNVLQKNCETFNNKEQIAEFKEGGTKDLSNFFCLKNFTKPIISLYEPIKNEPNILSLQDILTNCSFCFPRVLNNTDMHFENETGIVVVPDVCIVPGVAFTTSGDRLGYGKGFYDRFFAKYDSHNIQSKLSTKSIFKIGCCFKECLINNEDQINIEFEPHDIKMNKIIFD